MSKFGELLKGCDLTVNMAGISPHKNMETQVPYVESPQGYKSDELDGEISSLRSKAKSLQDREWSGTWRFNLSSIMALKSGKLR